VGNRSYRHPARLPTTSLGQWRAVPAVYAAGLEGYDIIADLLTIAVERLDCRSRVQFNGRDDAMRLIPKSEGVALAIKVVPGSSQQRIAGAYGDGLKITVTAAAERGAANEAVIAVLADSLQTAPSNVRIVSGHRNPRKEVLILGLTAEEIERRLLAEK
jgi:uncharacterized protein